MNLFARPPRLSKLRIAISSASQSSAIRDLPDAFAELINAFDNINVHPAYREDIYKILQTAVNLGNSIIDQTYPARAAIAEVTSLMGLLPRLIHHLTERPTTQGFAIMVPYSKQIYPQVFTTEAEANAQLASLQGLGAVKAATVVPVQITSDHVVRPASPVAPAFPILEATPLHPPIPQGIVPIPPPPLSTTSVVRSGSVMDPSVLEAHLDALQHEADELVEAPTVLPPPPAEGPATTPPVENPPHSPGGGDLPPPVGHPPPDDKSAPSANVATALPIPGGHAP